MANLDFNSSKKSSMEYKGKGVALDDANGGGPTT